LLPLDNRWARRERCPLQTASWRFDSFAEQDGRVPG
jgi:hypothetical protein